MHYVVIDTNVLVSSLIAEKKKSSKESKPFMVMNNIFYNSDNIIPIYNQEILEEYKDVLSRPIFGFSKIRIGKMINDFRKRALCITDELPKEIKEKFHFPDKDDIVFYQVSLSRKPSFLITGNISHFPIKTFIVTPAEYLEILNGRKIEEIRQKREIENTKGK